MTHPELVLNPRIAQWTTQAFTRLLATFAVLQGLTIIVGGEKRWSEAHYETAQLVPGAPGSWGILLLLTGAVAIFGSITGRTKTVMTGLSLSAVWCAFFSIALAEAVFTVPNAATTPLTTYSIFTVAFMLAASAYWQSHRA